jgi:hypothetical protein
LIPVNDFDAAQDVAAGPWVFFQPKYSGDWHLQPVPPDPFTSPEILQQKAKDARAIAEQLLPRITDALNRRNRTCRSQVFWRLMAFPWLLSFVQVFLEFQARADALRASLENRSLDVSLFRMPGGWPAESTADFYYYTNANPAFCAWMLSEFLRPNIPNSWRATEVDLPVARRPSALAHDKRWLKLFLAPRCVAMQGMSAWEKISISLFLSRGGRSAKPHLSPSNHAAASVPHMLEKMLWQTLPHYLERLDDWIPRKLPPTKPGMAVLNAGLYYSPLEKYDAARRAEAGERIVSVQHGSGYGNTALFSLIDAVEYAQDRFITWGWHDHQGHDVRALPLPSPYLSKFRRAAPGDDIIFVGGFMSPFPYRLDSRPQPAQFAACATDKLDFLNALPEKMRQRIHYRGVPAQPGAYDDAALVKANIPGIRLCKGDLHSQLMRAALVVLDNPGTTLNITMAANVPTLAFWDRNLWRMTAESETYFDRLRTVGILHDNPDAAAKHLQTIAEDIDGWWKASPTQEARAAWTQVYARVSPHWRRAWFSALKDL